jgi:hypothetical protein
MVQPSSSGDYIQPKPRFGRIRKWAKWTAAALSAVVVVLAILGWIYQTTATRHDARKYPAPGQLVDVGGYRLHIQCTGEGTPTVVMDAGLGQSLVWCSQPSPRSRACARMIGQAMVGAIQALSRGQASSS